MIILADADSAGLLRRISMKSFLRLWIFVLFNVMVIGGIWQIAHVDSADAKPQPTSAKSPSTKTPEKLLLTVTSGKMPTNTATSTSTNTPVAPTATPTDTPTNTPVAPTATPTDTPTNTPVVPTNTPT